MYLYPPKTPIPVYGTYDTIHRNGLISYATKPTRADGVPLTELVREESKSVGERQIHNRGSESDDDEEDDDEEEEEIVIGKGFDYRSEGDDDDDDTNNEIDSTRDDFDDLEANDDDLRIREEEREGGDHLGQGSDKNDGQTKPAAVPNQPDHFSPVNLDSPTLFTDFPVMRDVEPLIVELHKGDILYLPASWFHCVWSYADKDEFHVAVN